MELDMRRCDETSKEFSKMKICKMDRERNTYLGNRDYKKRNNV